MESVASIPAEESLVAAAIEIAPTAPDSGGRFACGQCNELFVEASRARCEVGYWRSLHSKALEREAALKRQVAELEAKVKLREKQLFGRKSERRSKAVEKKGEAKPGKKRKRGQQPGTKGHGRRRHESLPVEEEFRELPPEQRCCPACQEPFRELIETEDSELVEIKVRAHRRLIRRKRYQPRCTCRAVPTTVLAPQVPKVIPKGAYGVSFWVHVLLDKFLFQRPTHRLLMDMRLTLGLDVSPGTVAGGLKQLAPLFEPLLGAMIEKNLSEGRWHADETRWFVFAQIEGKDSHKWYLWVFSSPSTVIYYLDPSRSSQAPRKHFGEEAEGILNVDRYSAYKAFVKSTKILLAFCWSHVRRDFLGVATQWPSREDWALAWLERIGKLYALNDSRLEVQADEASFTAADAELRQAVDAMETQRDDELAEQKLRPQRRKVLESLARHWSGLVLFVEHPEVPMDNNIAERQMRNPVIGRKNYYGSRALWSGQLAAMLFSLIQTLLLWGINPRRWLIAYLELCAENGGKAPEDAARMLPWNMSEEELRRFQRAGSEEEEHDTS